MELTMTEDKKYEEYAKMRAQEKAHQSQVDGIGNEIADCSARLGKAREANDTILEHKLMDEQKALSAKRRKLKANFPNTLEE